MTPLSASVVEIKSKTKGLIVLDWTIRQCSKEDGDDSGWRLQALLKNESSSALKDVSSELRYFDSAGKFIGVDEGFSIYDDLEKQEDQSVSISLSVPAGTTRAIFSVKGTRTHFFEKHSFLLFGAALVISALIFTLGGLFRK